MNQSRRTALTLIPLGLFSTLAFPLDSGFAQRLQERESDEEQIRRVLRESQFAETLYVYEDPKNFDQEVLTRYWVPENKGGKAILQVLDSVRRLLDKRWHYSKDSANEEFVISSIKIFPEENVAEVRTRERWYVPMVDEQDHIVKEKEPILEYQVFYRLLKIDGKWLLQSNSTPRPRG
jgi:hypothetical protein